MQRFSSRYQALALGLLILFAARTGLAGPCQDRFCGIDDATHQRVKATPLEQRVRDFITANNLTSFQTRRGVPVFAVPSRLLGQGSGQLSDGEKSYLKQFSANTVEFLVGSHHLYTRVGGQTYDHITSLSERDWRGPYSQDRLSVLVHLTDSEMGRLRDWIDRGVHDTIGTLGRFNFGGGDPNTPGPNKQSNCTSWVTCARIGDRGESLGELMGLYNGAEPYSWVKGLATNGNSRVKAVIVSKPDESKTFDQNYLQTVFDKYVYRP